MPKKRGKKVKGTRKEAKALQLLKQGYSKKQVAEQVRIGVSTVYSISRRFRKQEQEAIQDREKLRLLFEDYEERHPPEIPTTIDGRIVV